MSARTVASCLRELQQKPGVDETARLLATARKHLLVLAEFDDTAALLGGRRPSEILEDLEGWVRPRRPSM